MISELIFIKTLNVFSVLMFMLFLICITVASFKLFKVANKEKSININKIKRIIIMLSAGMILFIIYVLVYYWQANKVEKILQSNVGNCISETGTAITCNLPDKIDKGELFKLITYAEFQRKILPYESELCLKIDVKNQKCSEYLKLE